MNGPFPENPSGIREHLEAITIHDAFKTASSHLANLIPWLPHWVITAVSAIGSALILGPLIYRVARVKIAKATYPSDLMLQPVLASELIYIFWPSGEITGEPRRECAFRGYSTHAIMTIRGTETEFNLPNPQLVENRGTIGIGLLLYSNRAAYPIGHSSFSAEPLCALSDGEYEVELNSSSEFGKISGRRWTLRIGLGCPPAWHSHAISRV